VIRSLVVRAITTLPSAGTESRRTVKSGPVAAKVIVVPLALRGDAGRSGKAAGWDDNCEGELR
jgi:hypothetical protein